MEENIYFLVSRNSLENELYNRGSPFLHNNEIKLEYISN